MEKCKVLVENEVSFYNGKVDDKTKGRRYVAIR